MYVEDSEPRRFELHIRLSFSQADICRNICRRIMFFGLFPKRFEALGLKDRAHSKLY